MSDFLSKSLKHSRKKKMRESVPRQVEKKSRVSRKRKGPGVLEEEIGVWNSQGGGKDKHFFFLHSLVLVT